jgi:hypothetical protein
LSGKLAARVNMYIQGHIDIVNELLPADYFDLQPRYPDFNKRMLLRGVHYVDAPCGTYDVRANRVFFKTSKLCATTSLINLFYEQAKGETELFQRHKGFFAHLHAMTTDPENSVLKIRNKIVVSVLGYSLLALCNQTDRVCPNALWAGMVLHTITDSYSPAHTIREHGVRHTVSRLVRPEEMDADRRARLATHERLKSLAKEDVLYSKSAFQSQFKSDRFAARRKTQLWDAYKSFKFEYDLNKRVSHLVPARPRAATGPERYGDVIAFQYYDNQPMLLHMKLDLLSSVAPRLYARMKDECLAFLRLYKHAIVTGDVDGFLRSVARLMLDRTFRVQNRYFDNKTNWLRGGGCSRARGRSRGACSARPSTRVMPSRTRARLQEDVRRRNAVHGCAAATWHG